MTVIGTRALLNLKTALNAASKRKINLKKNEETKQDSSRALRSLPLRHVRHEWSIAELTSAQRALGLRQQESPSVMHALHARYLNSIDADRASGSSCSSSFKRGGHVGQAPQQDMASLPTTLPLRTAPLVLYIFRFLFYSVISRFH